MFKRFQLSWAEAIWFALGLMLVGVSLAYLVLLPDFYEAVIRIAVSKLPVTTNTTGSLRNTSHDPYWIQTEFEMIQSQSILLPVITNLNLHQAWSNDAAREEPMDATYRRLKSRMEVRQYPNTAFFEIEVRSDDPVEAAAIANEIARVYKKARWENHSSPVQILDPATVPTRPRGPIPGPGIVGLLAGVLCLIQGARLRWAGRP
jgi:uncharacterized protein involved in exopolysaccharide biosynthesis